MRSPSSVLWTWCSVRWTDKQCEHGFCTIASSNASRYGSDCLRYVSGRLFDARSRTCTGLPTLESLSTTAGLSSAALQEARLSTHQLVDLPGWIFGVGIGAEAQVLCSEHSQDFVPPVHGIDVEYRCIILYVSGITIQYSRQEYATPLETGWI